MSATDRDEQLDEVLAAYLEAAEKGWAPDRPRLLACYPQLADDLRRFFADQDRVERVAAPLRTASADGTPPPDTEAGWPTVPGYEVLGEVGRGGMGVVYKARQQSCDRVVALKMILAGTQASPQERERFRSEAQAVARLQHPGIVQLFEVGEVEGRPYLALEYVAGGSLADRLDGTPLPPGRAAEVVETLARAVHHAHEAGVIHRDLKPANVLLAEDGTSKVTDFGLAKRLDADHGQTASGAIVGTPSYMAPEQAGSRRREIGPAADVYALGVILYELLTGRPPFRAATPLDTALQVLTEEPVPVRRLQPKVARDLETICLRCLVKMPEKRYATAAALAEELQRFREGRPILARPVGPVGRGWRWCRRNRAVAGLLTAVAGALLLGVIGATLFAIQAGQNAALAGRNANEARANEHRANDRAYISDLRLVQRAWEESHLGLVRELLEGRRPERTDGLERRGFEWYYWWRLSHRELLTLKGHTGWATSVCFSPDGTRLASGGGEPGGRAGEVKVWDARTGQELLQLPGPDGSLVLSVCFSPDGTRLAGIVNGPFTFGEVRVWDARTGKELLKQEGLNGEVSCVCFSPDGTRLATGGGEFTVWDAGTGREVLRLQGPNFPGCICFSPDGTRLATASDDEVKVWDARTGKEQLSLEGHTGVVRGLCFSADGQRLASAGEFQDGEQSAGGEAKVWDVHSGKQVLGIRDPTDAFAGVCFSPDGTRLAGANGRQVKVWDARTGGQVSTFKGHTDGVTGACFSPDGKRLASASGDGTVRVWDAEKRPDAPTFRGQSPNVSCNVCFDPAGRCLVTASNGEGFAKVWDARTGREELSVRGFACVRLSPDCKQLATDAADNAIKVWDVRAKRELFALAGHTAPVFGVCFSPDGRWLASGSRDGTVRLWDVPARREVLTLDGFPAYYDACFSPDGRRLACAGESLAPGGLVKVWDVRTGQKRFSFRRAPGDVRALSFSPDSKRLALASTDGMIRVLDADAGREELALKGHTAPVSSLSFSPDGQRLASGSVDRTVRVWDVQSGQELLSLKEYNAPVASVCFSGDGQRLAAASPDGVVKVWDAPSAPPANPPRP